MEKLRLTGILNSDRKHFHQYQQNVQVSLTSNHGTHKGSQQLALKIQLLVRQNNVAGLHRLMRSQPIRTTYALRTLLYISA